MKLALMLGGMAAGRRAGGPGELLGRGTKLIEASPELSRLVGEVRGRLLEAGKGAVVAVAARQVEALTDRVGKRVESLGGVGAPKRGKEESETDGYAEDEYAQDEDGQDEDGQDEDGQGEDGQGEDGETAERDEEPAEEPAPARPRRPRAPAKATAARTGKSASSSATVKRSASGGSRTGGRSPARSGRTQRSNGNG